MTTTQARRRFGPHVLEIDAGAEIDRLAGAIRSATARLHRKGAVVAVSGGIDSAVCVSLAARALGPSRVLGLLLPERDSSPGSTTRGRGLCEHLGIPFLLEDIGPTLDALGCYRRRDEAIRRLYPEFGPGWKSKLVLAGNILESDRVSFFTLAVQSPDGSMRRERMPLDVYLGVVAATNMKQRTRKLLEYHHAERLNYAVIGTPNRLEYDLGFFVRGGDGLADLKPIAHLYKTQVYALARALGVPEEIQRQTPSTDTYSLPQTQEEFYYALPYDRMDLLLYAHRHGVPAGEAGAPLGLSAEQVERVYRDIVGKQRVAAQLHQPAILLEPGPA